MTTMEPISPSARAKARTDAGEDPGQEVRQHDPAEDGELAGAERAGRLLHLRVELEQHRLHRPDDERERDEAEREHDRGARERDVEPTGEYGP